MTGQTPTRPTVVIGAGIIGAAIAHEMARRGQKVVLLERDAPGMGASFGNMASIAINGFDAISRPSTWRKVPFWLANPLAPVAVDPFYAPRMLPWIARFLAAGTPSRIRAIEDAGASLSTRTLSDLDDMLSAIGAKDMLSKAACLAVYGSEAEFTDGRDNRDLMDRYGLDYEVLEGDAIRAVEPLLSPEIRKAVLLPGNPFVSSPHGLVVRLTDAMRQRGGELVRGSAAEIERAEGAVRAVRLADGRRIEADRVLVAGGIASRTLAAAMGEPIPLETERGYHTQIMKPGIELTWSIIWSHRAFMITPTAGGIRVGGSVEMAGVDRAPNFRRARRLVEHAKFTVPSLTVEETTEWMGHRPALPDTIPILSASAKTKGLYYATGHGHFGLTWAATTARLMSDLMTGITPPVDLRPFRVDRF